MKYLLSGYFLHQVETYSVRHCRMGIFIYISVSQYQNTDAETHRVNLSLP